jgi:hypothetical protein
MLQTNRVMQSGRLRFTLNPWVVNSWPLNSQNALPSPYATRWKVQNSERELAIRYGAKSVTLRLQYFRTTFRGLTARKVEWSRMPGTRTLYSSGSTGD